MKNFILPKKIVAHKNTLAVENLKVEKSMQIGLNEPSLTEIQPGGFIVSDFGKELCGSLRILAHTGGGDKKVRVVYGESVAEAMSQIGEKGATNDHILRDYEVQIPDYSDTTLINSGFRFVKIESVGNSLVRIKSAVVVPTIYEKPFKGSFVCDDKKINKIFSKLFMDVKFIW